MNWQDVHTLRKAGQLQEAVDTALKILAADPEDFMTKSQYEWVIFDCIKRIVAHMREALSKSRPVDASDVNDLMAWMEVYRDLEPRIPEMVCSSILAQLVKVGPHLPKFPGIIRWVGIDGLRHDDWQSREYQEKIYPSLAMSVARTLCKWVKAHPDASNKQMAFALECAQRVGEMAKGDDPFWLKWDMAILLRRMGDFQRAAELLASVIRIKSNEFWVWAEAARLYAEDQPDLALACACRALECGSDPKFTVNVHRELAQMLAEREDFSQASRELVTAINIRQEQGWGNDEELQKLISSSWYDPSAPEAENPKDFYARNSQEALVLCFDSVEVKHATYLGVIVPHQPKESPPGRKVRSLQRFAVRANDGASVSIVGPGVRASSFKIGEPITLVVGKQLESKREAIVQISARPDGAIWDCTDTGAGIVSREASEDKRPKIFVNRDVEVGIDHNVWIGHQPPTLGHGVRFRMTKNQKNQRIDIFAVEPGPRPDVDVRVANGHLKRNAKGFAFVDDAFVPPYLVESIPPDVNDVAAVLVYAKHPKEERYGWRAVALSAG